MAESDNQSVAAAASESGSFVIVRNAAVACPFAQMQLGPEYIARYLSDAAVRLSDEATWHNHSGVVQALKESADPILAVELERVCRQFQEKTQCKVVECRSWIFDIAKTVVEILNFSYSHDSADLLEECNAQLDENVNKIMDILKWNERSLKDIQMEYHLQIEKHAARKRTSSVQECSGKLLALSSFAVSLALGSLVLLGWAKPDALNLGYMTNKWYKPTLRDQKGNLHYTLSETRLSAGWSVGLGFGGTLLLALSYFFRWRCRACREESSKRDILMRACAYQERSVMQNSRMWEGMLLCVEDLNRCVRELRSLDCRRKERIRDTHQQIGWKLFSVSMAVDEYIIWLSQRAYFPSNFSVRNLLQDQRYDSILRVFTQIQDDMSRRAGMQANRRLVTGGSMLGTEV